MTINHSDLTVIPGCCVEIELIYRSGNREHLLCDIVSDDEADYENGFIGISTPLAQALVGERSGCIIPYFTEELEAIRILSIKKSNRKPGRKTHSSRKEAIQETLKQIEFRDAVLFASSSATKWGSYDADGLDYSKWQSDKGEKDKRE